MLSFNFKNPTTYAFQNGDWKKSFLIGTLFLLFNSGYHYYKIVHFEKTVPDTNQIIFYFVLTVLNTILYMFVLGFFFINTNARINKPDEPLANWSDILNVFFTGFKASMAYLIYSLPVLAIYIFAVFAPQMKNFTYGTPYQPNLIILGLIAFLIFLLNTIGVVLYSQNLKFTSFFNPKMFYNLFGGDFACRAKGECEWQRGLYKTGVTPWTWNASEIRGQLTILKIVVKKFSSFLVLFLIFFVIAGIDLLFLKLSEICVYMVIVKAFVSFYLLVVKSDFTAQFIKNSLPSKESE